MKLTFSPASPFVRKVMVLLHETDQLGDVDLMPVKTTPVSTAPEVAAANPVGKIPALIRNDGPAIYDSRVITRFQDARAKTTLYPEARLWDVLTVEATADGIMEAAVLMVYEHRVRPADKVYDVWVESNWARVERSLDVLNDRWMSHLSGPLDMGQIAVGCALGYLDFRHDARDWRKGRDALAAWESAFATRPAMAATAPKD